MRHDGQQATPVRVEVLTVDAHHGGIRYRRVIGDLPDVSHPDGFAAALATAPLAVLHSTSWRYADGSVVLTYVAVLTGAPGTGYRPLPDHGIAHSGDPVVPSPPDICVDAVATHAVRHLAWLRGTDEVAATALAAHPDLWHALDHHSPLPAGGLDSPAARADPYVFR